METPSTKRVLILARLIFLWAALIVLRLLQLQVFQHEDYRRQAQAQQEKLIEVRAPRGTIFDRSGQRLAMSVPADSVCINPLRVPDLSVASEILARMLRIDASDLLLKMKIAVDNHRGFLWVKRKISPEESERLRSLKLDWIEFRTESKRVYPLEGLAAHILGGVDFEEKGNAGIEQALDDDLQGHAGTVRVLTDVRQRGYSSQVDAEPVPGKSIHLTIHNRLQYIAEQELKKAVLTHHCRSGSLVAMNPKTGEILALANYPTYNPNEPPVSTDDALARANLAVMAPFEPGSVFKVITLSAALETTRLRPETIIPCGNGSITLFGRTIHDHNAYPSLPMEDVLARSSNIGAINVGLKVGDANMYDYVRRFGFGKRIGLPLPGESGGVVRPLKRWQKSSIGSVAMGHEVTVTSLQLAQACSVVANGGVLVKPRLLLDQPEEKPRRVLRPETAITMRHMMEGVVIKPYGTGHRYTQIPGYTSGGKTGTAQIFDQKMHEYTHLYNASFMGFAPVTDPAVVVVVTVNGASGIAGYGGPSAGPVFREVAAAALRLLDVPKDLPDSLPIPDDGKIDSNDLAIAGLDPQIVNPLSDDPEPAGASGFSENAFLAPAVLRASGSGQIAGPKVPDFRGLTLREVAQRSSALGLPVIFQGDGLARGQFPAPGEILSPGERVRVQFGR